MDKPLALVNTIANGYENQIRALDTEQAGFEITALIPQVAKEYGARNSIDENVYAECLELIYEKFSHLGVGEIRQAFRELHSGTFTAQGAESYGGEFTAAQLAKTLAAYNQYRKKILAAMIDAKEAKARAAREEKRREELKQRFEKNFLRQVEKLALEIKSDQKTWLDIPSFWKDALMKRGLLVLEKEQALKIYAKARQIAVRRKAEGGPPTLSEILANRSANIEEETKNLARKLAVYELVIKPKIEN